MIDPNTLAKEVELHVRPQTLPLAIRMVRPGESDPPKAKRPLRDLGIQIAVCQVISMARRYGWTLVVGRQDVNCVLAKTAFGFDRVVRYYTEGHCCVGMYTETMEGGARTEAETHRFSYQQHEGILVAPATRAVFDPDVYVIYGNPAQVLRMLVGVLYKRGGSITSSFTGRLDCSDEIIRTMITQEPQVILPCYGDRVFGQAQDHEMAFSLPSPLAGDFVEGLMGTQVGGVRYPIPSFLRYRGQFPPSYQKLEHIWKEGDEE